MASAKKAGAPNGTTPTKTNGPARRTSSGFAQVAPLEPSLYPERELPAVPDFAIRETTTAKNNFQLKQRTRFTYYVTATRHTRDIRRYSDRFLKNAAYEVDLSTYLQYPISKGMFPNELIKKTVLVKRKKSSTKEVDLNELGEKKEGGEEESAEEGEEGEEGEGEKKKKKPKEGEAAGSESDSASDSDESDGGLDYGVQDKPDDDDEGFDDDGDGDEGQFD